VATNKLQFPISGFTDGLNTEASVLNVLPSEMMEGSTNVELLQNGSVRRRRAVDWVGASSSGGFLQTLRTGTTAAEINQESPSCIAVKLTAPNGSIIERVVVDLNNEFRVYELTNTALANVDSPLQTISRTVGGIIHADTGQKFVNMQFAQSGSKLFFAAKNCHPGYLQVSSDNTSLEVVYINILTRDPEATTTNSRVQYNSKWYECIKTHTSATANDRPSDGTNWETYWFQLDGAIPAGTATWANATAYTTTFLNRYDKATSVTSSDTFPSTVAFFASRAWYAGDPKYPNDTYFSQIVVKDADLEKYHQFADPFNATDPDLVADDGGVIQVQGAGLVKRLLALGTSLFICSNTGIWQVTGPNNSFKATDFSVYKVLSDGITGPENVVAVDDEFLVFGRSTIWRSTIQTSIAVTTSGQATFKSLSQDRVETRYSAIPQASKEAARAIYNASERRVYYFHNHTLTDFDSSHNNNKQPGYSHNIMVVDTRFQEDILETQQRSPEDIKRSVKGAFFVYELADGANDGKAYIAAPFVAKDIPVNDNPVVDEDGVGVVNGAGVDVVAAAAEQAKDVVLFLGMSRSTTAGVTTIKNAFGSFNTANTKDFDSDTANAASYNSIINAGIQVMGDALHKKAATYIYLVFKKVESGTLDSSGMDTNRGGCLMATAWDYSTANANPNYSGFTTNVVDGSGVPVVTGAGVNVEVTDPKRQIYFPDRYTLSLAGSGGDGSDHVWYKHRLRGRGNALQIIFKNDLDKDYHLIGWVQQFYGKVD